MTRIIAALLLLSLATAACGGTAPFSARQMNVGAAACVAADLCGADRRPLSIEERDAHCYHYVGRTWWGEDKRERYDCPREATTLTSHPL